MHFYKENHKVLLTEIRKNTETNEEYHVHGYLEVSNTRNTPNFPTLIFILSPSFDF